MKKSTNCIEKRLDFLVKMWYNLVEILCRRSRVRTMQENIQDSENNNVCLGELERLAVKAASDSSAAAELIALILPSIRAMARGIDPMISEDLLQEGLLGALSAIGGFDPKRGNARTYLLTCAKNKMLSSIKRNSLIGGYDDNIDDKSIESAATADEQPQRHQRLELLKQAIETRLTAYEREVVSLYLAGLSYREIAERLCSDNKTADRKSVDNAMQRARKKLRAALNKSSEG